MRKHKAHLLLFILFVAAAVLSTLPLFSGPGRQTPFFSYDPGIADSRFVQVLSGQPITVPFRFEVDEKITEVVLEIDDAFFRQNGIILADSTARIVDGSASSKAVFTIGEEHEIKPGSYDLKVLVKETATGRVLRSGKIPFIVDMERIVAKCSC